MTTLLKAYDTFLRTAAEVVGAKSVEREGPLWIAKFTDDQLFVTYASLEGFDIPALVSSVRGRLDTDLTLTEAEWKTRSHDDAPGLEAALLAAGFRKDEDESVMLGEAAMLTGVDAPEGINIRRVHDAREIRAALEMQDAVFGGTYAPRLYTELTRRIADGDLLEVWVAESNGRVISAGRIEPVPGTPFAGVWGGATLPEYRGRGVYRALTSARVQSVRRHGVLYVHSDSSEASRPILERSGLTRVTTTTPYRWLREAT